MILIIFGNFIFVFVIMPACLPVVLHNIHYFHVSHKDLSSEWEEDNCRKNIAGWDWCTSTHSIPLYISCSRYFCKLKVIANLNLFFLSCFSLFSYIFLIPFILFPLLSLCLREGWNFNLKSRAFLSILLLMPL